MTHIYKSTAAENPFVVEIKKFFHLRIIHSNVSEQLLQKTVNLTQGGESVHAFASDCECYTQIKSLTIQC